MLNAFLNSSILQYIYLNHGNFKRILLLYNHFSFTVEYNIGAADHPS
jgi:hypothetical protein